MILSHKHRFIFVAMPKTGTTSIQAALRPLIGPADEVTEVVRGSTPTKHMGAKAIRDFVGDETWRAYRTFAFVRNPYSMVVSWYLYLGRLSLRYCIARRGLSKGLRWYLKRSTSRESFAEFVRSRTRWTKSQLTRLCDEDGHMMIDFVGRYERLEEDFAIICDRLALRCELPCLNAHNRASRPFTSYYDDETREIVGRHCAKDLKVLGYSWPAASARFKD